MNSTKFDIDDSPEAVFQFMLDQSWSDGLPVVPPTADRVCGMLEYAQWDASEVVGYINPDAGSATVEKIAVNAVTAGCLPEYMPVLIAAVQAITEPAFNIHGLQTTTNPVSPLLIINGPVRGKIGLNSGRGHPGARLQGQRHHRAGGAATVVERGWCQALVHRHVGPWQPGQVHLLHGRKRGGQRLGAAPCGARIFIGPERGHRGGSAGSQQLSHLTTKSPKAF